MSPFSRRISAISLGLLVTVGAGAASLTAQEPAATKKSATQARRVPPYFNKVGVTSEQKEKIYAIKARYQEKVAALELQLEELKAKEMVDCEAVLTPAQRQMYETMKSEPKGKAKTAEPATKK